jgi:hypothetical protein
LLEVGTEILIVGVPPLAENYCEDLVVLPLVERDFLEVPLPAERGCSVVPLLGTWRYFDLVVIFPAEDFREVVGYPLDAAQ